MARVAAEAPRQIANANTLFNVFNTAIFIWFTGPFSQLLLKLAPDKPLPEEAMRKIRPVHLDPLLLSNPAIALQVTQLEILDLGKRVRTMVERVPAIILKDDPEQLKRAEEQDQEVDILHRAVLAYLGELSRHPMTREQTSEHLLLAETVDNLEQLADVIGVDMVRLGRIRAKGPIKSGEPFQKIFLPLHGIVSESLDSTLTALEKRVPEEVGVIARRKEDVKALLNPKKLQTLRAQATETHDGLEAYALEKDVLEKTKRMFYFIRRMARSQRRQ